MVQSLVFLFTPSPCKYLALLLKFASSLLPDHKTRTTILKTGEHCSRPNTIKKANLAFLRLGS